MGWLEYCAAIVAFFASHSVPLRPAIKGPVSARIGARGFTVVYSALSLGILAWLIGAAGRAPYVGLWPQSGWQNWVTIVAMLPVCLILATAIGRPNPFSFGGARNDRFDAHSPGTVRLTRHPLLVALGAWAAAHIIPNGDLAHVILFGLFAGFAVLGMRIIDRRKKRLMGRDQWHDLRAAVARAPYIKPDRSMIIRLCVGTCVYVGLLLVHPLVFGVSPLAW